MAGLRADAGWPKAKATGKAIRMIGMQQRSTAHHRPSHYPPATGFDGDLAGSQAERQSVRIFLDSSVLLSACGSEKSLSRLVTGIASERSWHLVSAWCCRAETAKNLGKLGTHAGQHRPLLQAIVEWVPNALTSKRPLLLAASKDKPVLISALAADCKVLLTLDKADFGLLLGTTVYGMLATTPREFLIGAGLG